MAKKKNITVSGVISAGFSEIEPFELEIPVDIIDAMLEAEADIIEPAVRKNAKEKLKGKYATGKVAESLRRKRPEWDSDGQRIIRLTFDGTRKDEYHTKGERNAAIAFLNEYGTREDEARSFIKEAMDESEDKAVEAAMKVYDAWSERES